jgi:inosine/xanthosine triphosphate pyrophosphatase family protein
MSDEYTTWIAPTPDPFSAAELQRKAAEQWQREAAEAYLADPDARDVALVAGLCAICHTPVRVAEDGALAVEMSDGQPGVIHDRWDCMDAPRCPEIHDVTVHFQQAVQKCVLPAGHPGDCYLGIPI